MRERLEDELERLTGVVEGRADGQDAVAPSKGS